MPVLIKWYVGIVLQSHKLLQDIMNKKTATIQNLSNTVAEQQVYLTVISSFVPYLCFIRHAKSIFPFYMY